MKIIDGNNMLHREADIIGRGIHTVRYVYSRYSVAQETTIIVWDGANGNKRRKEIFPGYKAKRKPRQESQIEIFNIAKAVLNYTPIIQVECYGWEADDVIGTLCKKLHHQHALTVESNDGDYWQFSQMAELPMVSTKWHKWSPQDLILYKAMVGDRKDGIPGLYGYGDKAFNDLGPNQRNSIRVAINEGNYDKWLEATHTNWPHRVAKGQQAFEEVCLYHKLNSYWTVPEEEINAGTRSGQLNVPAAEIFMQELMI